MEDGGVGIYERKRQIEAQAGIGSNEDKVSRDKEATAEKSVQRGVISTEQGNLSTVKPFITPFWANILYIVLILAVIGFMIFIIFWMTGEGKECLANPLQYYGEKTRQNCACWSNFFG